MRSNLFGFVLFQRTGMSFLLGDPNCGQHIENCFAFYFQLSCEIVNSNLIHPPLNCSETFPLSLHVNLTDLETVSYVLPCRS